MPKSAADNSGVFAQHREQHALDQPLKIGFYHFTLLNCLVNASEALTNCFLWLGVSGRRS
jgi:hypothetical protein